MDGPQLRTDELELGRCTVVCPPLPEFVGTKRPPRWTFVTKVFMSAFKNLNALTCHNKMKCNDDTNS